MHIMTRCVTLYFCCLIHFAIGQTNSPGNNYDSLYKALKRSSSDTSTIRLYHLLARQSAEDNPKHALQFEDSALTIARKINNPKYISITLTNIGSNYRMISEFQKSYDYLLDAVAVSPRRPRGSVKHTWK